MKSIKGKAIGAIESIRHEVAKPVELCMPEADGEGPKGNPSSAGQNSSKSKKSGNRRKRNKGRS